MIVGSAKAGTAIASHGACALTTSGHSQKRQSGRSDQVARSAMLSSFAPSGVAWPMRRATWPSATSVAIAAAKVARKGPGWPAKASAPWTGRSARRSSESAFAKFIGMRGSIGRLLAWRTRGGTREREATRGRR